jgi:hypothetical protein
MSKYIVQHRIEIDNLNTEQGANQGGRSILRHGLSDAGRYTGRPQGTLTKIFVWQSTVGALLDRLAHGPTILGKQ